MISRFTGEQGRQLLLERLCEQKIVAGDRYLAKRIMELSEPTGVPAGDSVIEQGAASNDLYLVVAGSFDVVVNGRRIARRHAGDHVGEMAAVQPILRRSATVTATEDSVVVKLSEVQLAELSQAFPAIWRVVASDLARRLELRNTLATSKRDRIRVLITSSAEALPIAQAIQKTFQQDPFDITVWTDGVFRDSTFSVTSLEAAVDLSDFAIAIVPPAATTRDHQAVAPMDHVNFELGLFIGRLGLRRAFLVEPRAAETQLPSDLTGVTAIGYRIEKNDLSDSDALAASVASACNEMRNLINEFGPVN
jgi:CRP/FNR family cyclic AMP-dependent transcriptional regulator